MSNLMTVEYPENAYDSNLKEKTDSVFKTESVYVNS